jgi:hypothetical protein
VYSSPDVFTQEFYHICKVELTPILHDIHNCFQTTEKVTVYQSFYKASVVLLPKSKRQKKPNKQKPSNNQQKSGQSFRNIDAKILNKLLAN